MIRWAVPLLMLASVSACAGAAEPEGAVANYDALSAAQSACAAKGGTLKLKPEGDPQVINDYACQRK